MIVYKRFFRNILFLSIFSLNIFTILIPIQDVEFLNSDEVGAQLLRGLGFRVYNNEKYYTIPRLRNNSITNPQNIDINPFRTHFKQSEYAIPGWADVRWKYRKNITIDHTKVVSDVTNFPVLIDLFDHDLQTEAQASGNDIIFADVEGNILDHEIEDYTRIYNSTHSHLVAWVRLNLSSSQDTKISMYYGNPLIANQENTEGVWGDNYKGVWHLKESPTGTTDEIKDSTANDNDGYTVGSMNSTDLVTSKIGKGLELDGADDMIIMNDSVSLDSVNDEGTLSIWLNWVNSSDDRYQRVMVSSNTFPDRADGLEWSNQPDGDHFFYPWAGNWDDYNLITDPFTNSYWHHLVVTLDYATKDVDIFIDGASMSFAQEFVPTNWTQCAIIDDWLWGGHPAFPASYFAGSFDEIRVSSIVRSTGWIQTEYNNQYSPNTFFSVANEEYSPTIKAWAFPQFNYRKNITIQASKVSTDLINFPALIDIYDSDLQNNSQASGNDIIFTDAFGNQLDHEIENYDQNSTHTHLVAWIRMNLSNTEDTPICMYFGNPSASNSENPASLWGHNYSAVWHLNEDPNDGTLGGHKDSTVNDNDGTPQNFGDGGGGSTDAKGIIDGAVDFVGDNGGDYITISKPTNTDPTDELTVSAWINTSIGGSEILSRGDSYAIRVYPDGRLCFYIYDGSSWHNMAPTGVDVSDNEFHYVVAGQDVTGMFINIDGVEEEHGSSTYSINYSLGNTIEIGRHGDGSPDYNFTGIIDEVRISEVGRSTAWIATEYQNQKDPDQFYTVGEKETYMDDRWAYKMFKFRKNIIIDENQVNVSWFDADWQYHKQITLSASSYDIPSGYTVSLTFDHAALVDARKSRIDGDDIRVIYWNDSDWIELDRVLDSGSSWNDNTTKIWFKTQALVPSFSSDNNYHLYYGNLLAGSPPANSTDIFFFYDGFESSDLSGWDTSSTGSPGDSISVSTDQVQTGSYSAKCEIDNVVTPQAIVWEDFTGQTNLFARIHLYLDPSFSTTGHVTIIQFIDTSSGWQNLISATINDDMTLYMWNDYYKEAYGYQTTNTISTGTWHTLEMQAKTSDTDGEARLWLDGNLEIEATGINLSTLGINRFAAGIYWASPQTEPNTLYFDDGHLRSWLGSEPTTVVAVENEYGLSNFPLLLNLSDSDLYNPAKVQQDGDDILFTDALGNKLDHEIELFDQTGNGTHAHLVAWVRVPSLYATRNTEITMYYGNNAMTSQENHEGVWNSDYVGVWHLKEEASGTGTLGLYKDSTSNGNDGDDHVSDTEKAGKIDSGQGFDGSDDYIDAGNASTLDIVTGDFTLEAWVKLDVKGGDRDVISKACDGVTVRAFELRYDIGEDYWIFNAYDDAWQYAKYTQANPEVGKWYHLVAVRDGSTIKIYVDGVEGAVTDTLNAMDDSSAFSLLIGRLVDPSDTRQFNGNIDEVRVSSKVRSSDWIGTEYNNQYDPDSFYSVSSEEIYSCWWTDASFLKRKDIVIDHNQFGSTETNKLEDFPFLLELYDAGLKTSVQNDGDDILFIDADGNKLNHEIEEFEQDFNSTHAYLLVWVRIPTLNLKDWTVLSMYYVNSELTSQANPEGVWTDDYVAVWHLRESGDGAAGEFKDSTSNNNDGQGGGNAGINPPAYPPSQIIGQIGYGQEFNETTREHIEVVTSESLESPSNSITIVGWVNSYISGLDGSIVFSNWGYGIDFLNGEILVHLNGTTNNVTSWVWWPTDLYVSPPGWHQYILTYDGSYERLYIDGNQVAIAECTGTIAIGDPDPNTLRIGSNPTWGTPEATGYVDGEIDEVRISTETKTVDWIKIEFKNQDDPDSLYSIGSEIILDKIPPEVSNFGVTDLGTGIGKFWAELTDGSGIDSVEVTINNTEYTMSWNGTYWVYDFSVESYQGYYEYLITNASDILGNYRTSNSSLKYYTFDKDTVDPTVLDWEYYDTLGPYGTFKANITDSWGEIDTVRVNVTTYNINALMGQYTTFWGTIFAYLNDTLEMPNGVMNFQIIVNDTAGNEFASSTHQGDVFSNHPPIAENLTLSPALPWSNCSLTLTYGYYDEDSHSEAGTEIRWYKKNDSVFLLEPTYNDTKVPMTTMRGMQRTQITGRWNGIEITRIILRLITARVSLQRILPKGRPGTTEFAFLMALGILAGLCLILS